VTVSFFAIAALMLAAALALILRPLLRAHAAADPGAVLRRRLHALQEAHDAGVLTDVEFAAKRAELDTSPAPLAAPVGRSRFAFAAAVTIAFALPVAALLLYRSVGDPRALDPSIAMTPPASGDTDHGQSMEAAITGLAAKLKQNPDDVEGWALLARAYETLGRPQNALPAYTQLERLRPDDPQVLSQHAVTLALVRGQGLDGEPEVLRSCPSVYQLLPIYPCVDVGGAALERGDTEGLKRAVKGIWELMPEDAEARAKAFESGVR